jgi:hypothetical protein
MKVQTRNETPPTPKGENTMKEFTEEMLNVLTEANDKMKGTSKYTKFHMATECKSESGRWFLVGYYTPHQTGIIKTFKENTYIITEDSCGKTRYHVTDEVKELLGI